MHQHRTGTSPTPLPPPTPAEQRETIEMNRQQILDLYDWKSGTCFRHPGKGAVPTVIVGVIRPREDGEREVRACAECVVMMEDIRREEAARAGGEYTPGRLGELCD